MPGWLFGIRQPHSAYLLLRTVRGQIKIGLEAKRLFFRWLSILNFTGSMAKEKRPVLDNLLNVQTPENISFQYRVAGPFRRLFSFILDLLFLGLIIFVANLLISLLLLLLGVTGALTGSLVAVNLANSVAGLTMAIGFFVFWFYTAFMETFWNGQTIGKMALRLRTLSTNGESIDGVQALLRNFFRMIDISPMVSPAVLFGAGFEAPAIVPIFMIGLLAMVVSRKYQRIGDLVAGTIVVHEQRGWAHGLVEFEDERVPQLAELIPHDFYVSSDMAKALASFVDRRKVLPFQRVNEIAGHLARPILGKLGMPEDTNYDLLLCSLYYKTYVSAIADDKTETLAVAVSGAGSEHTTSRLIPDGVR